MACGNNHVGRDQIVEPPDPERDPYEAARAVLEEAQRLATGARAQQIRVIEQVADHKLSFDPAAVPDGYHMWQVQPQPSASDYNERTGKMNVYTGKDGMPIRGNRYPHVHYFESATEIGAVASVDHEVHAGRIIFAPDASAGDIANELTILRQAIADENASVEEVERQVAELREALARSRRR
jgi:hypothetical protein